MFKKIMSLCLIVTMFLGSMISISAYSDEELDTRPSTMEELANSNIPGNFKLALPSDGFFDHELHAQCGRSYSAYREVNGDVSLRIISNVNTRTSFYRFYATDSTGNFTPYNDLDFQVDEDKLGTFNVRLPASSVTNDGYIYFSFAMVADQGEPFVNEHKYKVPVDYNTYQVTPENFLTTEPSQNYTITGMDGQFMEFNATANKRSNGNVFVQFNILNKNVNAELDNLVTDSENLIFLHSQTFTHSITNTGAVNISIYKTRVPRYDYVYFTLYFTATNGSRYAVEQIKIPIQA